jgi:hypothetical protein
VPVLGEYLFISAAMQFLKLAPEVHPLHIPSATGAHPKQTRPATSSSYLTLLPVTSTPWRQPDPVQLQAQVGPATNLSLDGYDADIVEKSEYKFLALVEKSLDEATAKAEKRQQKYKLEQTKERTGRLLMGPLRKLKRALGFPPRGLVVA